MLLWYHSWNISVLYCLGVFCSCVLCFWLCWVPNEYIPQQSASEIINAFSHFSLSLSSSPSLSLCGALTDFHFFRSVDCPCTTSCADFPFNSSFFFVPFCWSFFWVAAVCLALFVFKRVHENCSLWARNIVCFFHTPHPLYRECGMIFSVISFLILMIFFSSISMIFSLLSWFVRCSF